MRTPSLLITLLIGILLIAGCSQKTMHMNQPDGNQEIIETYQKVFREHTIPNTFIELAKFEKTHRAEGYAQSFYLHTEPEDFFQYYFDMDETQLQAYADRLIVFAHADGTGGTYALWLQAEDVDLEDAPVICYGSEGSISVVAQNLRELIKLLSYGAEGMDGQFSHYIESYGEASDFKSFEDEFLHYHPDFPEFRVWMQRTLGIEPIEEWAIEESEAVERIIENAQQTYKPLFDAWQYRFYPDPSHERQSDLNSKADGAGKTKSSQARSR